MTVSDGNIIKAVVEQTHYVGALVLNVHYWQADFTSAQPEDTVTGDLKVKLDQMYADIDGLQEENHSYDLYRFYMYESIPDSWNLIGEEIPSPAPDVIGENVASGVCAVVRAYTGVSRRMGRKFLSGFVEANFNGRNWDTTLQTAVAAYAAKWVLEFLASTGRNYVPGVYYLTNGFSPFNGEVVVNSIPGYQRRRKEGVGA